MSNRLFRRVFDVGALILVASALNPVCFAQPQGVLFPPANQSSFPSTFGLEENVGLSATVINNNYVVWFRGDRTDPSGITYLCGVQNLNVMNCPQDPFPTLPLPASSQSGKTRFGWHMRRREQATWSYVTAQMG
jgi:hypothetical protein